MTVHVHPGGLEHEHDKGDRAHKHNSRGAIVPMIPASATHVQMSVPKFEALMTQLGEDEVSAIWDDLVYVINLGPPISLDRPDSGR